MTLEQWGGHTPADSVEPARDQVTIRHADGTEDVRPVAATPEDHLRTELHALRRELEGVQFRLTLLDDPRETPPKSREGREKTLNATAGTIEARIAEIEAIIA